jgi:hypothetical protein
MSHSPGPFTVEELPDTAERDLGLTHVICGPCQIPEEQGEPVAVAFTFSADDAILFASVLDLLRDLTFRALREQANRAAKRDAMRRSLTTETRNRNREFDLIELLAAEPEPMFSRCDYPVLQLEREGYLP